MWRLAPELTVNMRERLDQFTRCQSSPVFADSLTRYTNTVVQLFIIIIFLCCINQPNEYCCVTTLARFSQASSSSQSLLTCSSESEKDDDEGRFEDIQNPDDHDMQVDQGNAFMIFNNTVYLNVVNHDVIIDHSLFNFTGASDNTSDWDSSKVRRISCFIHTHFCFFGLRLVARYFLVSFLCFLMLYL